MRGVSTWGGRLIIFCACVVSAGAPLYSARSDDSYVVPDVVISEIMWAKSEYVELYNTTSDDIPLAGWVLTRQKKESDSEDVEVTFTSGDVISAHSFFLVANSDAVTTAINKTDASIGLVDTGALIRLRKEIAGLVVDSANQYESNGKPWYAGENNSVGISMERRSSMGDGEDEGSWYTSTGSGGGRSGTPGEENSLDAPTPTPTPTPVPSASPLETATPVYSESIRINEFIPNPTGDDTKLEFIELYNSSEDAVDISGWKIDDSADAGSSPFTIPEGAIIPGRGYAVFYSDQTKISLNNDSDHVRLVWPDGVVQDDVEYASSKEGYSYNHVDNSDFQQSNHPTPGEENSIELPTPTPTPTPRPTSAPKPKATPGVYDFSSHIVINEIYPNPTKGDVNSEFIEIKNLENRSVALSGWALDDEDGGSGLYHFKMGDKIGAKKIMTLDKNTTKIALNNSDDSARLIDPHGKVVAIVSYQKTFSGQSLSRVDDGAYQWSDIATPGKENIISVHIQTSKSPSPKKPKKSISKPPQVAGITRVLEDSPLPTWPGMDSRRVVQTIYGRVDAMGVHNQKQVVFLFFGLFCAGGQLLSGISKREKIWFG